jgi:2-methylisocitrate lyase-like PEP mutase family enzyme
LKISRPTVTEKRRTFRLLHESGCFVIPNPWDVGSALYLQHLGFRALATTSSGFSWSLGKPDGATTLDEALSHFHALVEATDVPINADFGGGFASEPARVAEHVELACQTGIAGLSIEDSTGSDDHPLYDLDSACERMRAARHAIDRAGGEVLLVGRAECFLVGRPDITETVARLKRYAHAGADCLYAPGVSDSRHIQAIVDAVAPRPVNILVGSPLTVTVASLADLGVRRISVGGALARSAWEGFMWAAQHLADHGRFDLLPNAPMGVNLDSFFATRTAD